MFDDIYDIIVDKPKRGSAEVVGYENGGLVVLLDYGDGNIIKKLTAQGIINGTTWYPLKDFNQPTLDELRPTSGVGRLYGKVGFLKSTTDNGIFGIFDVEGIEIKALLEQPHHTALKVGVGTFSETRNPWVFEPPDEKVNMGRGIWFGPYKFSGEHKLATYCDKSITLNVVSGSGTALPKSAFRSPEVEEGYLIVDRFMSVITDQEKQFEGAFGFIDPEGETLPNIETDVYEAIYDIPEQFSIEWNPTMSETTKIFTFYESHIFNEGISVFNYYMKYDEMEYPSSFEIFPILYYTSYPQPWWSHYCVYSKERRLIFKTTDGYSLVVL